MKTLHLPSPAYAYIRQHYPDALLSHIRSHRDTRGHVYYDIQISQDDLIHRLKFNEHGAIIRQIEEEAFPENGFAESD